MIVFIIIFIIEVINYDKINGIFIWFIKKKKKLLDLMLINILIYKVFFEIFKLLVKLLMYILI